LLTEYRVIMNEKKPTVAEVLLKELFKLGVEYVFLVPGAQIVPLLVCLFNENKKDIPVPIIASHELAAGFMALGYARASGKIGVALSIGGPGASYMIGAGVTAKADDVPILFITGNIPPEYFDRGEFQDASNTGTNDSEIFQKAIGTSLICKKSEDFGNVMPMVRKCYYDRKPLHVQIPINVQRATYEAEINGINNYEYPVFPTFDYSDTEKTVLLIGHLALNRIDHLKLRNFVKRNNFGVVTDMKTRGIVPETDKESLGYLGFNSDLRALEVFNNQSLLAANSVVSVGAKKNLFHRYIDEQSVNIMYAEPDAFDKWISTFTSEQSLIIERGRWLNELNKITPPQSVPLTTNHKVSYSDLLETINKVMPDNTVVCLDAGQIRRAGSIFLKCKSPRSLIQSDTLSPMGSGICASIGAQIASSNKHILSLFGDGSMRMHGMELATAVRYNLPIIFVLCDNKSYASVKAQDEVRNLPETNWGSYADLIGIKSYFIDDKKTFMRRLEEAFILDEPVLLWTMVPGLLDDELEKAQTLEYKNWLSSV